MKRLALVLACGAALAAPAAAQMAYQAPRLSDGQPDLQGQWTNESSTKLERDPKYGKRLVMTPDEVSREEASNALFSDHYPFNPSLVDPTALAQVMRVGGEPRTSLITSTPDGRIPPLKAGAAPSRQPARPAGVGLRDNPESASNGERCLAGMGTQAGPVMLPSLSNNNYQIIQSKDFVAIETEMVHEVRIIRLNATHRTDGVRPWFGDSIGHWDGDTLVVETTNFPRQNAFRGSWEHLKVTERFTRVGDRAILYRFTVSDPTLWDKPWGGEYEFRPSSGPIYEYACHEGDQTLEGILSGARYEEAHPSAKRPASTAR